jgi:hypothetical protein
MRILTRPYLAALITKRVRWDIRAARYGPLGIRRRSESYDGQVKVPAFELTNL